MTAESTAPWTAPAAAGPLHASVTLPGSKSLTNRLLLLAALGDRETRVIGALESEDSTAMRRALTALGAVIAEEDSTADSRPVLRVTPLSLASEVPDHRVIDVNQAGTVMRFVPVIAGFMPGTTDFTAHASALSRPMGPLFDALRTAGVRVTDLEGARDDVVVLPARVTGLENDPERELSLEVDATSSSQFLSALLLGANAQSAPVTVRHTGGRIPSRAHVEMTVQTLRDFGVAVEQPEESVWRVTPGVRSPETITVEPDLSNAGPFLAAALVAGGTVTVPGWPLSTTQIGDRWRTILPQLGAEVTLTPDEPADGGAPVTGTLTVTGGERILPADIDDSAELAPVLAALLALAPGESRLTGIAHLRGHETDRLAALATEIRALGAEAEETEDGLIIRGTAAPRAVTHSTYHDHRMATAAAVWALAAPGTLIESIEVTAKTMPDFPSLWTAFLGGAAAEEGTR